ncbi:MAG: arginase family protein, partial [Bdellovibrionales bacterium]|nr:arginase family protein [Bdellovibrionales bacterium]
KHINTNSLRLNQWVYAKTISLLESGKIVACLGGEHSIPYGAIKAYSERNSFSILHIDAHADLRVAYQGFEHSHASIMNQVMTLSKPPQKLVQVGIRDFCAEEYDYINEHKNIKTYFDYAIKQDLFSGKTWIELCEEIVDQLGENVYISFDIDGLLPELCPQTGTPVPGGLSFEQAVFLLKTLSDKGKKIIGFDLCEVAQRDSENYWDGVVGARVLYQLCGWCLKTQNGSK